MKKKDFLLGQDARDAIEHVADQFANIVGSTMGPAGRNYMLPDGVTNDGKTIAYNIRLDDEGKDDIALSFCEVADRTDHEAGDGTSTATVMAAELAKSLIREVPDLNAIAPGATSVMELTRKLEAEKDRAVAIIEGKAVPVKDIETLERVAMTAMEDEKVAKLIAETIFEAGKDSYTAIEEGYGGEVTKSVFRGIRVPAKTAAPFMHNNDKRESVFVNTAVLVVDHAFEDYSELKPFMQSLMDANTRKDYNATGIVIVARHFSIPFIGMVANTSRAAKFPIVLLQLDAEPEIFEDLAEFLDAQLIDTHPRTGRRISEATFKHCGRFAKMVANTKETVFIGGKGLETLVTAAKRIQDGGEPTTRVEARVEALKGQLANEKGTKRDELKKRIAKLSGGIATIFVDAQTAQERHYLKLKVEDAMNACKSALGHGVIAGGGQGLKEVAEELGEDALLYPALMAPFRRIQQNAGGSLEIPDTVIDSAFSASVGLKNAVSVVKVLLTTEGIISNHVRNFAQELGDTLYESAASQ